MYEQFLADPSAVDSSWHDFFADYRPAPHGENGTPRTGVRSRPDKPSREQPSQPLPASAKIAAPHRVEHGVSQGTATPLRGAAARVVANMETSLELPTATSVRAMPAKLLVDNRIVINNHLRRTRGGKIS
ncbi:MAG: 2-oxoglutarate dehydrogenase E1 subunit family protein, partial [Pseudonocardiaceae bacterium]